MCADLIRVVSLTSEAVVKRCPGIAIILTAKYAPVNPEHYNKFKTPTSWAELEFKIQQHLLTPCSTVLLEQLTGSQLVNKFPAFYGTRRFTTAFTSARHLSLSWASSIQFLPTHPTSWRSILILSSHLCLGLPSGPFHSSFPKKILYTPLLPPYVLHAPPISFFLILSPEQYFVSSTDH